MNNFGKFLYISIGIFIMALTLEHYFRDTENILKPSLVLGKVAEMFEDFFEQLGKLCAWLSSFLTLIKLDELFESIRRLLEPMLRILFSAYYFCIGYFDYLLDMRKPYLVLAGSLVILFITTCIMKYYSKLYKVYCKILLVTSMLIIGSCFGYLFIPDINWCFRMLNYCAK